MATANSAQREPSMEEILASIRRIIEDSDGGRQQPSGAAGPAAAETLEDDIAIESAAPELDAFRSELRAADGIDPAPKKPISLAEVQAQLAAAPPTPFERNVPSHNSLPPHGEAAANAGAAGEADMRAAFGQPRRDESASENMAAQRAEAAGRPEFTGTGPVDAVAGDPEEQQVEIDDSDLVLTDEPFAQAMPRPALVSEETSRQVAAAFGELSEAFASRSRKSFDEMAEEMLRPMLQDWLDNNLPTLVERLVREEIERVARGGA